MADFHRLVKTSELKTDKLTNAAAGNLRSISYMSYDEDFDALVLLAFEPESDLIVHYLDGDVALLYEDDSMQIVGLQVENFQLSFVPMHADLNKTWTLSDALGKEYHNLGEMMVVVERFRPKLAQEIINAAKDIPKEFAALFAA